VNFKNLQDLEEEYFEQQLAGNTRQVFLDHIDHICFLPLVTYLLALIWITYTLHTCRIEFMVSRFAYPCSYECRTSISILYDVGFGLCLCESV
jgi:hypothetical protein